MAKSIYCLYQENYEHYALESVNLVANAYSTKKKAMEYLARLCEIWNDGEFSASLYNGGLALHIYEGDELKHVIFAKVAILY